MKLSAIVSIIMLVLFNFSYADEAPSANRPAHWAEPMHVDGVPNLHKVSDSLYRSAQPSAEGMANLKAMGIVTIVNLRSFHSDRYEIGNLEIGQEHIYMKPWHAEAEDAVAFLQIVTDPNRTPLLLHCQHGADRTGLMKEVMGVNIHLGKTNELLVP